jgi:pimeloyl-ACP methyl ester carboxylesterase
MLTRLKLTSWPLRKNQLVHQFLLKNPALQLGKQLPTWYQVSENDRIIPPDAERLFAKQMNATTISLPSSHASLVSHPNEIAQLILNATKGIAK